MMENRDSDEGSHNGMHGDMSVRTITIINIIIITIIIITIINIIIIITHTCPEGEVTVRSRSWIRVLPVLPVTAGGSYHAMVTL